MTNNIINLYFTQNSVNPKFRTHSKIKTNKSYAIQYAKINQSHEPCVLGMISRTFSNKKSKIIVPLYKALVRPHLDYCIQAWRPHFRKDVDKLERVQRRATRMIEECRRRDYETRLGLISLTT